MASFIDKIREAQAQKDQNGNRVYSDDQIWSQISAMPQVRQAIDNGSSEGDVQKYLGLSLAPPAQDPNPVTRYGKMIGGNLLSGAEATLGMPGTGLRILNSLMPPDWQWSKDSPLWMIPDAQAIQHASDSVGLTDRPDAQPQNFLEKELAGASQGLGASLPLLPIGGEGLTPQLISSGIASGLGESTMDQIFPNNPLMSLIGSVGGAIAGQGGMRALEESVAKSRASGTLADLEAQLKDFDSNHVFEQVAKENVRNGILKNADAQFLLDQNAANAAANVAKAGPISTIAGHAASLDPTIGGWQDAGEALRAGAQKWYEDLPNKLEKAWDPLDSKIKGDAEVPLTNFASTLQSMNKQAGSLQGLVNQLTPSLPRQLHQTLNAITGATQVGVAAPATWNDVRALRTALGDSLANPQLIPSIGANQLKALYGALTQDLSGAATSQGLGKEFAAANQASSDLFSTAEGPIAQLLDTRTVPGDLAKRLYSKGQTDATMLTQLRGLLPDEMNALASAGLRPQDLKQLQWAKLTPDAKAALVPDTTMRTSLDDATQALSQSDSNFRVANTVASSIRNATKDGANEVYKQWQQSQRLAKAELQNKLAEAQAAAKATGVTEGTASAAGAINRLTGIIGAGSVGGAALHALGVNPDAFFNSELATAAAVGLPAATYGVNQLIKHPDLMAGPLIGVSAGTEAQKREGAGLP